MPFLNPDSTYFHSVADELREYADRLDQLGPEGQHRARYLRRQADAYDALSEEYEAAPPSPPRPDGLGA